jgi:outer membrane protein OmpA-like peptidoglycan-associated protein
MKTMDRRSYPGRTVAVAILAAGFAWTVAPQPATAGDLSAQQILEGLKPSKTRSLSASTRTDLSADDLAFIKRVRHTRSLSMGDREHMAAIAAKRPKIDLDINFDFNSAKLTPKAEPQLDNLGKALTSPDLSGAIIMLGGHTDAKGSDAYNQRLSEQRAATVKQYLVTHFRIPPENLLASGYGEKGLKNPADPYDGVNRRVEIVNVAAKEQASNLK